VILRGLYCLRKDKAMLRFVKKVTLDSSSIDESDVEKLGAIGWDDTSIYYAIAACGLFNFYNRFVLANGVRPVSDEAFRRLGKRMAEHGYVRE
jgi:alkylhydroperoxidase family enzyme